MLLVLFSSDSCLNRERENVLHAADSGVADSCVFTIPAPNKGVGDGCVCSKRGRENASHTAVGDVGDGIVINSVQMLQLREEKLLTS